MIATVISMAIGQNRMESRAKLKFRPPAEWFSNMQPQMDPQQSPSYYEQSDQPSQADNPFQDFYLEDYEPETMDAPGGGSNSATGGNKFVRHPSMEPPVFQSLCPTSRTDVFLQNKDFEYRPSSYVEVKCELPSQYQ